MNAAMTARAMPMSAIPLARSDATPSAPSRFASLLTVKNIKAGALAGLSMSIAAASASLIVLVGIELSVIGGSPAVLSAGVFGMPVGAIGGAISVALGSAAKAMVIETGLSPCGEAFLNTGRGIVGGIVAGGLLGITTGLCKVLPEAH